MHVASTILFIVSREPHPTWMNHLRQVLRQCNKACTCSAHTLHQQHPTIDFTKSTSPLQLQQHQAAAVNLTASGNSKQYAVTHNAFTCPAAELRATVYRRKRTAVRKLCTVCFERVALMQQLCQTSQQLQAHCKKKSSWHRARRSAASFKKTTGSPDTVHQGEASPLPAALAALVAPCMRPPAT
jgi:hypothetical protein